MAIHKLYPPCDDQNAYNQAMDQLVMAGNWIFNRSDMDLWVETDGYTLKIPAGKRTTLTGWDTLTRDMETLRDEFYGVQGGVYRGGFQFVGSGEMYIYDSLVVFSPDGSRCGGYYQHHRTLEECIALINRFKLEKIHVIGFDLSFLLRCPSIRNVTVHYSHDAVDGIDFSPLYAMDEIESLTCCAPPSEIPKASVKTIDFTKIHGLKNLSLCQSHRDNFHLAPALETLFLSGSKQFPTLQGISCSPNFKKIDLLQCGIRSLDGIEKYPMQQVNLSYLRALEDISALSHCAETLRALSIEACGKIRDFSCLYDLHNLEHLNLMGSNHLPDLEFLRNMPKLKTFVFSMEIDGGDLSPCLDIPYVSCCKMKRHYNLKEKDLPKTRNTEPFRLT